MKVQITKNGKKSNMWDLWYSFVLHMVLLVTYYQNTENSQHKLVYFLSSLFCVSSNNHSRCLAVDNQIRVSGNEPTQDFGFFIGKKAKSVEYFMNCVPMNNAINVCINCVVLKLYLHSFTAIVLLF